MQLGNSPIAVGCIFNTYEIWNWILTISYYAIVLLCKKRHQFIGKNSRTKSLSHWIFKQLLRKEIPVEVKGAVVDDFGTADYIQGRWVMAEGWMPSVVIFLRDPYTYLCNLSKFRRNPWKNRNSLADVRDMGLYQLTSFSFERRTSRPLMG